MSEILVNITLIVFLMVLPVVLYILLIIQTAKREARLRLRKDIELRIPNALYKELKLNEAQRKLIADWKRNYHTWETPKGKRPKSQKATLDSNKKSK